MDDSDGDSLPGVEEKATTPPISFEFFPQERVPTPVPLPARERVDVRGGGATKMMDPFMSVVGPLFVLLKTWSKIADYGQYAAYGETLLAALAAFKSSDSTAGRIAVAVLLFKTWSPDTSIVLGAVETIAGLAADWLDDVVESQADGPEDEAVKLTDKFFASLAACGSVLDVRNTPLFGKLRALFLPLLSIPFFGWLGVRPSIEKVVSFVEKM